mgnify:CR=1 FL=1
MMEALKVMTYFKVSLSTCNWDSAKKKPARGGCKDCNTHQEAVLTNRQGDVTKVQLY